MLKSIGNIANTLTYYLRLQEVTANNLAQASTPAFKASRLAAHGGEDGEHPVPVGWTDWKQGALHETGRPLDVALEGPGFLTVQTPRGERLLRGGSLDLDPEGRLVDLQGNPVLGQEGPLFLYGSEVEVREDGTLIVDGAGAGQLRLVTVDDPAALTREDGGLYAPAGKTRPAPVEGTRVRQGRIEEANLDSVFSLIDLVSIHRAYAANTEALKAMDRVLGIAVTDVGDA